MSLHCRFFQRIELLRACFEYNGGLGMKTTRLMRSLRLAALIAAFAGIVLLATGAAWWHVDNPGSVDACPICCHVAHISALPGSLAAALVTPAHVAWVLPLERLLLPGSPSVIPPPSRAPPVLA